MNDFEKLWRTKLSHHTGKVTDLSIKSMIDHVKINEPIEYTNKVISILRNSTSESKVKNIFQCTACHLPHEKLMRAKKVYSETMSVSEARKQLENDFRGDIKLYKQLSNTQVEAILDKGWGLAGKMNGDKIIATKIPSQFHKYFEETDDRMKKFYYCHCPRVRKQLLDDKVNFDSIYCNCGGGFYKDVWEFITDKPVSIKTIKTLFDNDDICQFEISFEL